MVALVVLVLAGAVLRVAVATDSYVEHHSSDEYDYERIALSLYESRTYGRGSHDPAGARRPGPVRAGQRRGPVVEHERDGADADGHPGRVLGSGHGRDRADRGRVAAGDDPWRRMAGGLAAAAVAVYPPLVRGAGELLSEPLGTLLLDDR